MSLTTSRFNIATATIASGQTVSDVVDLGDSLVLGLQFATMTGTAMTFQVSQDGETYVALKDESGNSVSITIASNTAVSIADSAKFLAPWRYVKLVSGSAEGAERSVKVSFKQ